MDYAPLVIVLLVLGVWLRWEYSGTRRRRIATHTYFIHKKSRGRVQRARKR